MPLSYQELTEHTPCLMPSILGAATFVGMTFPTAIGTAFPESSKVITSPQIKPSGRRIFRQHLKGNHFGSQQRVPHKAEEDC